MNESGLPKDNQSGFAYRDLLGIDRWEAWTVSGTVTLVGTPTYVGRYRFVGAQCFFQISAIASTSIASTAGTSFFALPRTAIGIGGSATATDDTTNIALGTGVCHIDVTTSRCYLPTFGATGSLLTICGWFEIGA